MVNWKNLDQLSAYHELAVDPVRVDLRTALAGEQGARRVRSYTLPMAGGL